MNKTKEQLLAELNCAQKHLWRVTEELNTNHKGLGTAALQSAGGHLSLVKQLVKDHITT